MLSLTFLCCFMEMLWIKYSTGRTFIRGWECELPKQCSTFSHETSSQPSHKILSEILATNIFTEFWRQKRFLLNFTINKANNKPELFAVASMPQLCGAKHSISSSARQTWFAFSCYSFSRQLITSFLQHSITTSTKNWMSESQQVCWTANVFVSRKKIAESRMNAAGTKSIIELNTFPLSAGSMAISANTNTVAYLSKQFCVNRIYSRSCLYQSGTN